MRPRQMSRQTQAGEAMTPFQWGIVTGAFLFFLVEVVVVGVWITVTRPRSRPREIGRDEIAQLKG